MALPSCLRGFVVHGALLLAMVLSSGCYTTTHRFSYLVPLQAAQGPEKQIAAEACYLRCAQEDPEGQRRFFSCIAACPGAVVAEGDLCDEFSSPDYGCHLWKIEKVHVDPRQVAEVMVDVAQVSLHLASAAARSSSSSRGSSSTGSSKSGPTKERVVAKPSRSSKPEREVAKPSRSK